MKQNVMLLGYWVNVIRMIKCHVDININVIGMIKCHVDINIKCNRDD